jgi:hypothetical protein
VPRSARPSSLGVASHRPETILLWYVETDSSASTTMSGFCPSPGSQLRSSFGADFRLAWNVGENDRSTPEGAFTASTFRNDSLCTYCGVG